MHSLGKLEPCWKLKTAKSVILPTSCKGLLEGRHTAAHFCLSLLPGTYSKTSKWQIQMTACHFWNIRTECHECFGERIHPKSKRRAVFKIRKWTAWKVNLRGFHFTLGWMKQKQFGETNSYPDLWFEPQVVRCLFSLVAHRMIKQRERKRREQFAQARLGNPI